MPVSLGEVLFPLRYDVYDQAPDIKELCLAYGNDTPGIMEAGCDSAIHRHLVIADPAYQAIGKLKPRSGAELEYRIERYYGARMTKLTDCYWSIKRGWDRSQHKIYYKQVVDPTTTSLGNPVPDGLFLADGQHRTIALLALGYNELPEHIASIQVKSGAEFQPLDLTWAYIQAGECTEQKFVDFARFRFPDIPEEIVWTDGLFEWAYTHALDWLCNYIEIYWR